MNNPTVALVSGRMSRGRGRWLPIRKVVITAILVAVAAAKGAAAKAKIRGEDLLPIAAGFSEGVYDVNASNSYAPIPHGGRGQHGLLSGGVSD